MGKKTLKENPRVVVYPPGNNRSNFDTLFRDCESIASQIKRHVDGLSHYGNRGVMIEYDTRAVCEHCGWTWTEESDVYNGGCCEKDRENDPELVKATGDAQRTP